MLRGRHSAARAFPRTIRYNSTRKEAAAVRQSGSSEVLRPGSAVPPRLSYEYPPPPKPDTRPAESSPWRRHVPLAVGIGGLIWAVYAWNYIFNSDSEQTVLQPDKFAKFVITHKEPITKELMLVEVAPKVANHDMLKSGSLWNGKKLWSVEIKHPNIQIVRRYTPLPLYYMHTPEPSLEPLLRMLGSAEDQGRMVFLIKRYDDGEMSRYIHSLPVGGDIELRGPYVEVKFPYTQADMQKPRAAMCDVPSRVPPDAPTGSAKPDNIAFFAGGTGISPALQCLLSPNPPRGLTQVYDSVRNREDIPFGRFLLFLEKVGRAKFHFFVDSENKYITASDIPEPVPAQPRKVTDQAPAEPRPLEVKQYTSAVQQHMEKSLESSHIAGAAIAVVTGPPGYVRYVSGEPGLRGDNPIGGLLGAKGWTLENTRRMLDV